MGGAQRYPSLLISTESRWVLQGGLTGRRKTMGFAKSSTHLRAQAPSHLVMVVYSGIDRLCLPHEASLGFRRRIGRVGRAVARDRFRVAYDRANVLSTGATATGAGKRRERLVRWMSSRKQ